MLFESRRISIAKSETPQVQPDHQTDQENRLRISQPHQLSAPYPQPHRGHPTAEISSMNGDTPLKIEEPLKHLAPIADTLLIRYFPYTGREWNGPWTIGSGHLSVNWICPESVVAACPTAAVAGARTATHSDPATSR